MNGYSKIFHASNINIDTLNHTGFYFIRNISSSTTLGTYPSTIEYAAHLIQSSESYDPVNARFQIMTEFNKSKNTIWFRKASNNNSGGVTYSDWQQLYPDYRSKNLNVHAGYVIFTNGLRIQFNMIYVPAGTEPIFKWVFPISFTAWNTYCFHGISEYASNKIMFKDIGMDRTQHYPTYCNFVFERLNTDIATIDAIAIGY